MSYSALALDGHPPARGTWSQENDRGLAHAASGEWDLAISAFAASIDALTTHGPLDSTAHEVQALVTGNLAHACFQAGRYIDALRNAQRTCALRVAIAGEDAMPVARARMDLAVILASAGRGEEAMALVQRAITAVEHHVGSDDVRLAIVLENAGRIALALDQPSNAEPLLLRLHALLHAHDLSTSRADTLLGRVAQVRQHRGVTPGSLTPLSVPVEPAPLVPGEVMPAERLTLNDLDRLDGDALEATYGDGGLAASMGLVTPESSDVLASRAYAHASIDSDAPWEDQPLRDTVRVTGALMRSTPSGMPAIHSGAHTAVLGEIASGPVIDHANGPILFPKRKRTVVLPTPTQGAVAVEAPSRRSRSGARAAEKQAAERRAADASAKPLITTRTRSGEMLVANAAATLHDESGSKRPGAQGKGRAIALGLAATTVAGGGAYWWFMLR